MGQSAAVRCSGWDVTSVPDHFARHARRSGLTAPWEPIYAHHTPDSVILAIRADVAHTNSRGLVHGGLIGALADNAMGLSCGVGMTGVAGLATVSLSIDFLSPARKGQWLEFRTGLVKRGGTLCFAQCVVAADADICASARATFRVLAHSAPGHSFQPET